MLENVDMDYENSLKSIYNIEIEEEDEFDAPFFKAMKVPGTAYIPGEEDTTVPDRTTEQLKEADQGG